MYLTDVRSAPVGHGNEDVPEGSLSLERQRTQFPGHGAGDYSVMQQREQDGANTKHSFLARGQKAP